MVTEPPSVQPFLRILTFDMGSFPGLTRAGIAVAMAAAPTVKRALLSLAYI